MVRPEHVKLVRAGEGRYDGAYLGTRHAGHLTHCFVDVDGVQVKANQIGEGEEVKFRAGDLVAVTWEDRHACALEADPEDPHRNVIPEIED
jgi:hypothetical protein